MESWRKTLKVDPVKVLLEVDHPGIRFQVDRDLLDASPGEPSGLWAHPEVVSLCRRQKPDGRWEYPGITSRPASLEDYDQIETYRILRILVEKFCLDRTNPIIEACADYLFSRQSSEGDFRGIYGRQYTPNYSAGIIELLVKAGFLGDDRIGKSFDWLLSIRQADGGWAIPIRTLGLNLQQMYDQDRPLQPDRSKPFSHLVTGVVLRAFASHPEWNASQAAVKGAALLSSRMFKPDSYVDRRSPEYWERVSFPFWFTDIVSALDSLTLIRDGGDRNELQGAIRWLVGKQRADGCFDLKIVRGSDKNDKYWIALAISRIFKRFFLKDDLRL